VDVYESVKKSLPSRAFVLSMVSLHSIRTTIRKFWPCVKRADGTHDFEWAFVGAPKDVANPSAINSVMFNKVAHNPIGAAPAASLTDEEAVDLFDKLLAG
jgi:hypothetical protein